MFFNDDKAYFSTITINRHTNMGGQDTVMTVVEKALASQYNRSCF